MNWWMFANSISITCLAGVQIMHAINQNRYTDMVWEMDKALIDVEARLAKLEDNR